MQKLIFLKKFLEASLIILMFFVMAVQGFGNYKSGYSFSRNLSEMLDIASLFFAVFVVPIIFIELTYYLSRYLYRKNYNFIIVLIASGMMVLLGYVITFYAYAFDRFGQRGGIEGEFFILMEILTIPIALITNLIIQWVVWDKHFRKGSVIETK